jgi:hypothetical protein
MRNNAAAQGGELGLTHTNGRMSSSVSVGNRARQCRCSRWWAWAHAHKRADEQQRERGQTSEAMPLLKFV